MRYSRSARPLKKVAGYQSDEQGRQVRQSTDAEDAVEVKVQALRALNKTRVIPNEHTGESYLGTLRPRVITHQHRRAVSYPLPADQKCHEQANKKQRRDPLLREHLVQVQMGQVLIANMHAGSIQNHTSVQSSEYKGGRY